MHSTCRLPVASALRLAATLALAATSTACIQIEVELPEICRTARFTFTTPANGLADGTLSGTNEQVVGFLPGELTELTQLTLTSGAVSIYPANAVDELKILLRPPEGSTGLELTLLHMKPVGEGGPVPDSQADLLPYLGGKIAFQISGTPPDGANIFIAICASAKAVKEIKLR